MEEGGRRTTYLAALHRIPRKLLVALEYLGGDITLVERLKGLGRPGAA